MRGGHSHWRDVSAKQKCLSVTQKDVAVADIGFSCTQGFNLPALQGKSRFELFFDKVFVTGALVKRDGRLTRFMCFFLRHKRRESSVI